MALRIGWIFAVLLLLATRPTFAGQGAGASPVPSATSSVEADSTPSPQVSSAPAAAPAPPGAPTLTDQRGGREATQELPVRGAPLVGKPAGKTGPTLEQLEQEGTGIDWGRQVSFTAFCLLITCGIVWVSLKFGYGRAGLGLGFSGLLGKRNIRILERNMLTPQRGIMLIEVAGKVLLVGMTEHQISTLAEVDPTTLEQAPSPRPGNGRTPESPFQFQQTLVNLLTPKKQDP